MNHNLTAELGEPNSPWSVGEEISLLLQITDPTDAMRELVVRSGLDINVSWQLHTDAIWVRRGAETYILYLDLVAPSAERHALILKAAVPLSFGQSLASHVDEWFHRRSLLSPYVNVPQVHGRNSATWLEDVVGVPLEQSLSNTEPSSSILNSLAEFAGALAGFEFAPTDPFRDLRLAGDQLFAIDFGEDLGPPASGISTDAIGKALENLLKEHKISTEDQRHLIHKFEQTRRSVRNHRAG